MKDWYISSVISWTLFLGFRPLCAIVGLQHDSKFKRTYCRTMNWWFGELNHVNRITAVYLIGSMLREFHQPITLDPHSRLR